MANARSGDASGMDHHPVPPALGRRVAHRRQFGTPIDRAHIGRAKLKAKLCSPNLDDWRIRRNRPRCVGPRTTVLSSNTSSMMPCLVVSYSTDFELLGS